jgi:20S proteasome alpha/beta subunit
MGMVMKETRLVMMWVLVVMVLYQFGCDAASFFEKGGKLKQVELAVTAASSGGSVVAVLGKDVAVAVCWAPAQEEASEHIRVSPRCRVLCDNVGYCSTGVGADATHLCNRLFDDVANHDNIYGSAPVIGRLAKGLASYVHESTLSLRHRPFGVRSVILGRDPAPSGAGANTCTEAWTGAGVQQPALFEIDPLGNCHSCKLACLGPYGAQLMGAWPVDLDPSTLEASRLVMEAVEVLRAVLEKEGVSLRDPAQQARLEVLVGGPGVRGTGILPASCLHKLLQHKQPDVCFSAGGAAAATLTEALQDL